MMSDKGRLVSGRETEIMLSAATELASYIQIVNAQINNPEREHDMQTCQELAEAAVDVESMQQEIERLKAELKTHNDFLSDVVNTFGAIQDQPVKAIADACSKLLFMCDD
jgi:hypothetical protein